MNIKTKLQKNVRELEIEGFQSNVLEESSTNKNEISKVKNIFKIGTPLP
jgi:hypothetical protein